MEMRVSKEAPPRVLDRRVTVRDGGTALIRDAADPPLAPGYRLAIGIFPNLGDRKPPPPPIVTSGRTWNSHHSPLPGIRPPVLLRFRSSGQNKSKSQPGSR